MPQRFLRPQIRTSERWNAVSHKAHTLYISILTQVDDYGRYDGRVSILWADAFTVWNEMHPNEKSVTAQETAALCQELSDAKLVEFYELDGKRFLQVVQWKERARGDSKWPDPEKAIPLRNPAERCGILPPSPSPSPSPLVISSSTTTPPVGGGEVEEIYDLYPRKVAKQDAMKAIYKAVKKHGVELVRNATANYAKAWENEPDKQFCPYPATWFNRGSYMDDPTTWKRNGSSLTSQQQNGRIAPNGKTYPYTENGKTVYGPKLTADDLLNQ